MADGTPLSDRARLAALARSQLMDSEAEEVFDRLTRLAARLVGAPIALMTFLDNERQYVKSGIGTSGDPVPLSKSFCQHVVRLGNTLKVTDVREDPRMASAAETLVDAGLIAYCGVPLIDSNGHTLGSLCTMDHIPRVWSDEDVVMLRELATSAMTEVELRVAYRDLAAREQEVRSIVDNAHEAFISARANGRVVGWNPGATRLLGHGERQTIGRDVLDLIVPAEMRPRFRELLGSTAGMLDGQHFEYTLEHRDGHAVEVEASVSIVESPEGPRMNVLMWDVGELRRLRRHQAHLAAIVEAADEGIGHFDLDHHVTAWNPAAERIYGWPAEELLGRRVPWAEAAPLDGSTRPNSDLLSRVFAGETAVAHGVSRTRRDGRKIYVDLTFSPMFDNGEVIGATVIIRDVTEQHQLELELASSEDRFRRTFDDAPNGITLVDPDRRLLSVNRAFCEMLGYRPGELIGRTLDRITHPDDLSNGLATARSMIAGEMSSYATEKRYHHRSGRIVRARLTSSLVRDAAGEPSHFIAHIEDVTAAHDAREAAREAGELLEEAQSVAHVGSWSLNLTTYEVACSHEQLRLHGLPAATNPTAQEFLATVHPDDIARLRATIRERLRDPAPFEVEYRTIPGAGGVSRTLQASARPLAADPRTGRDARFAGTTRDITIEREAQRAQHAVEERHRRLLANLPDTMVVLYDAEQRLELMQGGLLAKRGIDPDEHVGRPLGEVIGPEGHAILGPRVEAALAGESSSVDFEAGEVVFQIEFAPYWGDGETISGVFTVWRDVTAQRQRELENLRLATLVQQSEDAIFARDREGTIIEWNRGAERLLGYTREEAIGRNAAMLIPPDHAGEAERQLATALRGRSQHLDTVRVRKDGRRVDIAVTVSPLYDVTGAAIGSTSIARDITERMEETRARHRVEERLRVTVEHAPIGVALVGLEGGAHGRLVSVNEAFTALMSDPDPVAGGLSLTSLVHPDDVEALRSDLTLLSTDDLARTETEVRCLHPDGTIVWMLLTGAAVPSGEKGPHLAVVHALDIGERKRFEGQLQHLADHDALTGLFNRRRFESEFGRAVSLVKRYGQPSALLMIDLDGFKQVNDTLGHSYGDEMITRIGTTLRSTLRETDVIGRLGGDEFAVILPGVGPEEAAAVGDKILQAIQQHGVVVSEHRHAGVTASVGVAPFDRSCELDAEELLVDADAAMYRAKESGKNQLVICERDVHRTKLTSRQSWETRLRAALDEDRFELFAQPIQEICAAGSAAGYELLLRLRGDDDELIAPGTFLYNAERFGLIGRIDRWVFGQALALLSAQNEAGNDISLSVNMSGKTLGDPDIIADLKAMVSACPIPADRLVVEVTETAAIVNIERARDVSRALRELGCRFALDDFGAGFASFYYLKHLDFDYVKIDGEFVKSLNVNPTDQLVVRSVVDIARGLGARTVAEFVGNDESVSRLRELGVDYGQGYHLGRPAPVAEVLPVLVKD